MNERRREEYDEKFSMVFEKIDSLKESSGTQCDLLSSKINDLEKIVKIYKNEASDFYTEGDKAFQTIRDQFKTEIGRRQPNIYTVISDINKKITNENKINTNESTNKRNKTELMNNPFLEIIVCKRDLVNFISYL